MRDLVNSVRTAIKNYDGYVYIPDLSEYMTPELKNLSSYANSKDNCDISAKTHNGTAVDE